MTRARGPIENNVRQLQKTGFTLRKTNGRSPQLLTRKQLNALLDFLRSCDVHRGLRRFGLLPTSTIPRHALPSLRSEYDVAGPPQNFKHEIIHPTRGRRSKLVVTFEIKMGFSAKDPNVLLDLFLSDICDELMGILEHRTISLSISANYMNKDNNILRLMNDFERVQVGIMLEGISPSIKSPAG